MEVNFKFNAREYTLKDDLNLYRENKEVVLFEDLSEGTFFIESGVKVFLGKAIMEYWNRCYLPREYWDKMKVVFKDKDKLNFTPTNLFPYYKEKIEHPSIKGFYFIPGEELNVINSKGEVYQLKKDRYRLPYLGKEGEDNSNFYPFTRCDVVNKDNRLLTHRLIGLTFCDPPEDYPNMHVDHKNGDKQDFSQLNLQWLTPYENMMKGAYKDGNNKQVISVDVYDKLTKNSSSYPSLSNFANVLGVNPTCVINAFNTPNKTYKGRYVIKATSDNTTFEELLDLKKVKYTNFESMNLKTGEVFKWRNVDEFIKNNGGGRGTIRKVLENKTSGIVQWHIFRKPGDSWNTPTDYDKEIYRRGLQPTTKVYEIQDLAKNKTHICYGKKELIQIIPDINSRTITFVVREKRKYKQRYLIKTLN
ncbi:hypothetical protein [Photobacterium phage PDCC-1]|uniref:HNH nuclease domain-containing protein n=2 Tax=Aphroditevirus TaxID=2560092 RepID=A0A6B9J3X1_9CAUD|nr:hypothetical protein HWC03_gp066 [Vibrio phage 2 TSL-2019]YP_009853502.1 hypothetical protein HWC77_gp150 [Photobacterium phage PDCC-1]QAU04221.1 hypothetical protein [Vibrio phage 2 TSL-2019]QGZ14513.1 hypothetical protein [Photobacterium phage PDCC-1]